MPNGMFSIVEYDSEQRDFVPARNYGDAHLGRLLRAVDVPKMQQDINIDSQKQVGNDISESDSAIKQTLNAAQTDGVVSPPP